jgi:hypothetical protein
MQLENRDGHIRRDGRGQCSVRKVLHNAIMNMAVITQSNGRYTEVRLCGPLIPEKYLAEMLQERYL